MFDPTRCCLAALFAVAIGFGTSAGRAAGPATRPVGVAVVELFTSQGCSSCPPAEAVLGGLATAARADGRPVFTLAFHVDYWNRLGWADPFSDPAYSDRQQQYGQALKLDQIYTPQTIVNGRTQFIGSDAAATDRAVAEALATPVSVQVTADVTPAGNGGHTLRFGAAADPGVRVHVAVVERGLRTSVKRGENAGRDLDQPSVVRWFTTVPAAAHGEVAIPTLSGVRADRASVVVFAQVNTTGAVLGATSVPLQ
jgi:hypothetical protein